jgi:hypothetical protein
MKIFCYSFSKGLRILVLISSTLISIGASAQVVDVTPADPLSVCPDLSYSTLTDIKVSETDAAQYIMRFSNNKVEDFVLGFDGGSFEFDVGTVPTLVLEGAVLQASPTPVVTVTTSEFRISFDTDGAGGEKNSFTISGLRVGATAAGTANIVRKACTSCANELDIDGDDVVDAVSHGSLTAYPAATATLSIVPGTTICATQMITFGGLGVYDNYEFILDPAGARTSLQSGPSSQFSTTGMVNNDVVSVIVIDANGCSDESAGQLITVNAGYTASLTSDATADTSCDGDPVIFTASTG